ncbi:MAG: hypothetical protein IT538_04190 [Variibacter sp.]|nr:hypothetical protein [Variibacter sp.]
MAGKRRRASGETKAEEAGSSQSDSRRQPQALNEVIHSARKRAFALPDGKVEELLRTGDEPALMEELFGAVGHAELRALAREAATRAVRGGTRVLILPGIMGSKLG